MKRLLLILLSAFVFISVLPAQNTRMALPESKELKAINDSIITEAFRLYLHEKIAWTMEDIFFENCKNPDDVLGWTQIQRDTTVVSGIFYNKDKTKVIFEGIVDYASGKSRYSDKLRDITPEELEQINVHEKAQAAVSKLEDGPAVPEGCTANVEIIQIGEDLYRVFWMLGTSQNGIIPFGCDLSYDCDSDGNILDSRRYHRSYIPTPTQMNGEPVREIFHSHTTICPYIAPTDIALFLLYGYELAGLKKFKVYSSVFGCTFTFDTDTFSISVEK